MEVFTCRILCNKVNQATQPHWKLASFFHCCSLPCKLQNITRINTFWNFVRFFVHDEYKLPPPLFSPSVWQVVGWPPDPQPFQNELRVFLRPKATPRATHRSKWVSLEVSGGYPHLGDPFPSLRLDRQFSCCHGQSLCLRQHDGGTKVRHLRSPNPTSTCIPHLCSLTHIVSQDCFFHRTFSFWLLYKIWRFPSLSEADQKLILANRVDFVIFFKPRAICLHQQSHAPCGILFPFTLDWFVSGP